MPRHVQRLVTIVAILLSLLALPAATAQGGEHVVAPGETLSSIAARYDTTVEALRNLNGLSGDLLRVGQVLALPQPPGWRTIEAGSDATWQTLAQRLALPAELLRAANPAFDDPASRLLRVPPDTGPLATPLEGEDLIAFSARIGAAPGAIAARNGLVPPYRLVAGQPLLIPEGFEVSSAAEEASADSGVGGAGVVRTAEVEETPHGALRERAFAQLAVALTGTRLRPPDDGFSWPLAGTPRVTSRFGWRSVSVAGNRYHLGLDLGAASGTLVLASRQGTVRRAGWIGAYGYAVYLDHGDGFETRYAHLSRVGVLVGQRLARGEALGRVGSTGASTGPHLHFEVRQAGSALDPLQVLPEPSGGPSTSR